MSGKFQTSLRIDVAHPSLAGHFPGNPVVPGVVVLERVAAALRAWRGEQVERLDAKFVRPLRPGEAASIALDGDGARVRFEVTGAEGGVLARGTLMATDRRA
ncbi:MAG TPA: hydroxymyristoyl-ACP dehydratase [Rhodanobacteraceae bacterium]|jgi:3-hydroxymyristoyl/3-hydroxydecanoyl-(acyl carrier protein) dehydratase|nr:hydroxymyristoyl-ACP dehydratase [Rhodanobacteraceae bacterium]